MLARLLCVLAAAALAGSAGAAAPTGPGTILFRCGDNLCSVAPDGSGRQQLTTNGRKGGPSYGWLSATKDGSRLGVAYGNKAYILDRSGRRVKGPFRSTGGGVLQVQIRPDGRQIATIEQVFEILQPPPPSPSVEVITPYLFLTGSTGAGRDTVARTTATTAWLGNRLMRDDSADAEPFEQLICLLASNADSDCARPLAVDPGRDLWGPAASSDGRFIAVARAPLKKFAGQIAVYSSATGERVRSVTNGTGDSQPSWSPDGKRIVFTRGRALYVVSATGGPARRIAAGIQPVWVSAK